MNKSFSVNSHHEKKILSNRIDSVSNLVFVVEIDTVMNTFVINRERERENISIVGLLKDFQRNVSIDLFRYLSLKESVNEIFLLTS